MSDRIVISLYSLAFYPWKSIVPLGLSPLYELPAGIHIHAWPFALSAAAVLAITALAVTARRRWPALAAAWAAYVAILLPVLGIVHNGHQIAADRYTYLPCLPWAVLAGWGLASLARGAGSAARAVPATAAAALLLLAALSWQQSRVWHDSEVLWRRALAVSPGSVAHSNLGLVLARAGDTRGAIPHYEEAIRLRPTYAEAWSNLGIAQAQRGDLAGAANPQQFLRAVVRRIAVDLEHFTNLEGCIEIDAAVADQRGAPRPNPSRCDQKREGEEAGGSPRPGRHPCARLA